MALSKQEAEKYRHESPKASAPIERKSSKKVWMISSLIAVLIVAGVGFSFVGANKPGDFDGFAQCLTDKGAVMYGASFCQYSHAQKSMFGKSEKHLDIRDFGEDSNIKVTPTWVINGNYYENVQTFDRLAKLSGCSLE
jgi:hypothetical protein